MKYRPEIDGLRTIAIVPVIIYHLKIPVGSGMLLPGGFLGVDVFLVLSGFLITKIILDEMQTTGTLSIARFYERRARRILPALLLVILASLAAGLVLLSETEMQRLTLSALAALGFVSNGFWYLTLGEYGAQSGLLQPLLHTWSLAVEEQFYLLFPLLLLLLKPAQNPRWSLFIICGCLLASLISAEITTSMDKQLSFFAPWSRAWELLVGSVLALVLTHHPRLAGDTTGVLRIVPLLCLGIILGSMAFVDLADWRHPGLVTLPVVLATAGIIWCARDREPVTYTLSTRPVVYIGRLSYSLYLWHFPVFAFGRLASIDKPDLYDMAVWLAVTFACSVTGYHLIERRFRFDVQLRPFVATVSASVVAVVIAAALTTYTDLLKPARTTDLATLYGGDYYDNERLRDQSWGILGGLSGADEEIGPWNAHRPSVFESDVLWFALDEVPNLLVVGNSHSKDLFNMLQLGPQNGVAYDVARFGMGTRFPQDQREVLYLSPNFIHADVVLIASRYSEASVQLLPDLVRQIQEQGKVVVIVGNTPEFVSPGTIPIYDWYVRRQGNLDTVDRVNDIAFGSQLTDVALRNTQLRQVAVDSAALYLSRVELLCSQSERTCTLATPDGRKTMYDYGHWTEDGARYFGSVAADTGWLASVLDDL